MESQRVLSLKNIVVFIIIGAVIVLAIKSLDIILMLFASFVITCAILPIIHNLEKYIPRIWAVTLVLLGLILASFLILVPIITISVREVSNLADNFPNILNNFENLLNFKIFNQTISELVTFDSIKEPLAKSAQSIVQNSIIAGKLAVNFITTTLAISIMVFYFTYDEKRIKDKFIEFFPLNQKEKALKILDNISSKVGNYIFAQAIAMIFVGAITTIGLVLIHNHHAFILGVITCVLDIIPVIGPTIAVAIGLIASASGGFVNVLITFVVYMVAQWAQNQLLRHIIFGKLLNMHPLMIIVALLISARFLGFWGVVLSPAIASALCVLVDELYLDKINNRE